MGGKLSRRDARDPGLDRGATVVMAIPDASAMQPDQWDLDFLRFLPLVNISD